MTTFSKYLQAKMDEKGWKQSDLAKASGINPKSISEYMNLGVIPQAGRLAKIARALGATESEVRRAAGESPKRGYFKLSQERQDDADTLDREQARLVNELIRKFAEDNRKAVTEHGNSASNNEAGEDSPAQDDDGNDKLHEADFFKEDRRRIAALYMPGGELPAGQQQTDEDQSDV